MIEFYNFSTLGTIAALRGCTIYPIPALRTIKLRRPTLRRQVNLSLSWAGRSGFGPSPAGTIVPGEWGLRCRLMTSVPFRCELSHWMGTPHWCRPCPRDDTLSPDRNTIPNGCGLLFAIFVEILVGGGWGHADRYRYRSNSGFVGNPCGDPCRGHANIFRIVPNLCAALVDPYV